MNPSDEETWSVVAKNTKTPKMSIDRKKTAPRNKATQPSIIKETMVIEPDMMGQLAGHNGINLKQIKEIYGVNISLPPRGGSQIILEGTAKMISAAKKYIEENLLCRTSFFIEKHYVGLVVGRKGTKKIAWRMPSMSA